MGKVDCGMLAQVASDGVEFRGHVQLGNRLDGTLTLRKHRRSGTTDDHPDYSIEYTPRNGGARPIGAGWIKNGARAGDFISMTLDDPDWPSPLYLTAFPPAKERGETSWIVVWSRPRDTRVQDERSQPQNGG